MSAQTQIETERRKPLARFKQHERKHVPGVVAPFLLRELISELTPAEWMIWTVSFLHANREMFCCLKHETISSETGLGWNAVHKGKRGLIEKGWLTNCGQREKRGPNVYRLTIPIPETVTKFIDFLWDALNRECWWEERVGIDKLDYSDDHLDWLIAWRVIRAVKENDQAIRSKTNEPWTPQQAIGSELMNTTVQVLLNRLREASKSLAPDRGLWWLFGDGLDSITK